MISSNNPVIQHEVIVYNITLCTNTLFTMLYIQYVFRFHTTPEYVLHLAMLVLQIDYSSKYKSYASEPFLYNGTGTQLFRCMFWINFSRCRMGVHPSYQSACSLLYRYSADIRTCTDTDARVMVQNR